MASILGVGVTTTQMVVQKTIVLIVIVVLMIPALYFVIRKAQDRRGYGPAILVGIAFPLIVANSLYELITGHSNLILRIVSNCGSGLLLIGVAWNASLDIKFMNGIRYCIWPCCPNCCKSCQKYQQLAEETDEL